ncbi:MAG: LCP family protein [Lachnospiraceae bacterium]|nr:LCP family protein [Lachnospiraceae bacterium]
MSRYDDNFEGISRRRGPNWTKTFAVVLSIVLAVVVLGGVLVYTLGNSLINMTNYVSDQDVQVVDEEELPEEAMETVSLADKIGEEVTTEKLEEIQEVMVQKQDTAKAKKKEVVKDENVFNFLLVGVDRRDKSWNGNSDSMMLVSINYQQKRISVVSLMRDTYVDIPEVGYNKLNNAYARGGGPLLTATVSDNYGVAVSNYAAVDFENMIQIVDAIGGVDLELTASEIIVANGYMMDMCDTLGLNGYDYILPTETGTYHCNGVQAVAYARNRYVGNSDYARTERQRYVISQIIRRVKDMNVTDLSSFVTEVLPLVTHNMQVKDIWDLVRRAPELLEYNIVMDRIPYDGHYDVIYVNSQDMLVPDWEYTINQLHETIYGNGSISENSDNNQEDRTIGNNEFSYDFEDEILNGGAQEETPYSGDLVVANN